jgi:mannan polymerase II complex MNN10 subunit
MRRLSSSLPRFAHNVYPEEKKNIGGGSWSAQNVPLLGRLRGIMARMGRKMKIRLLIMLLVFLSIILFYTTRECLGICGFMAITRF